MTLDLIQISEDEPDGLLLPSNTHAHKAAVFLQKLDLTKYLAEFFNSCDTGILSKKGNSYVLSRYKLTFLDDF